MKLTAEVKNTTGFILIKTEVSLLSFSQFNYKDYMLCVWIATAREISS